MPVNWNDPQDVASFRSYAVSSGKDPENVEAYIRQNTQPKIELTETGDIRGQELPRSIGVDTEPKTDVVPLSEDSPITQTPSGTPPTSSVMTNMPSLDEGSSDLPVVTQPYGNINPELEKYSGGKNLGTDFRAPEGTPLRAPKRGTWVVETAQPGWNTGSGNLVRIVNPETGERIAFEHLSKIGVKPGQRLQPGQAVALTGNTGNSTGPHASIPYQNLRGEYQDIRSTPYATDIFGGGR